MCWCSSFADCGSAERFSIDVGSFWVVGPAPWQQNRTCVSGRVCSFDGVEGLGLQPDARRLVRGILEETVGDRFLVQDRRPSSWCVLGKGGGFGALRVRGGRARRRSHAAENEAEDGVGQQSAPGSRRGSLRGQRAMWRSGKSHSLRRRKARRHGRMVSERQRRGAEGKAVETGVVGGAWAAGGEAAQRSEARAKRRGEATV